MMARIMLLHTTHGKSRPYSALQMLKNGQIWHFEFLLWFGHIGPLGHILVIYSVTFTINIDLQ